jgi:tyrosyl-tRNA synthetase
MIKYDELLFNRFSEDWTKLPEKKVISLLRVKTQTVIPGIKEENLTKKPLNVKLGIDPTGADIHIGHLCPIFILNIFQKCGHHIDFVIGDFTAKIGDPSGRNTERQPLTDEQIAVNFASYKKQITPYIDTSNLSVRQNSEWLGKIGAAEFMYVLQNINLAAAMQRDDFRKRIDGGGITLAEVCYASLMGLDSVALKTDIELGGIDQLLNFGQCRIIQEIYGQKPEIAITTPILEGTSGDGRKMSKSYNNYIAVTSTAEDKFGKFMSLPDDLLIKYYRAFGYLFDDEIPALEKFIAAEPMEAKKQLAAYFVSIDGRDLGIGRTEREKFEKKFSKKELTDGDFIEIKVKKGTNIVDAVHMSGKFASKGEIRRLLQSGAVKDTKTDQKISADFAIGGDIKIKVGKLNYFSLTSTL